VFGTEGFGTGAADTLRFVQESFVPFVVKHYAAASDVPVVLGGYSLAGLFSLWSAYQTDMFAAVAAVSPSVWFPKWDEYAGKHAVQTERIYLSLGKREEKTGLWQRWETAFVNNINNCRSRGSGQRWNGTKGTIFRSRMSDVRKRLYGVFVIWDVRDLVCL
jgi:enterochelin esterase-like enzyme